MSKPREEIQNEEYFREIHFLYEIVNSLKIRKKSKISKRYSNKI